MYRCLQGVFAATFLLFAASASAQTPFLDNMFDVEIDENVIYGTGIVGHPGDPHPIALQANVFSPVGLSSTAGLPAVLLIHGGGFVGGDKEMMTLLGEDLASRGYVAIAIDYRTFDEGLPDETSLLESSFDPWAVFQGNSSQMEKSIGFSAAIKDTEKALDWVYANAVSLGVDVNKLIVGGGSAGARVALAVGLVERPYQVSGILSMLGSIDNNEDLVSQNVPPFVLFNGTDDPTTSFSSAELLADIAQGLHIPFNLFLGNDGHDATDFFVPPAEGEESHYEQSLGFFYDQLNLGGVQITVLPEFGTFGLTGLVVFAGVIAARRRRD